MFCADVVSLADGRIAVVGGSDWYNEPVLMDKHEGDPTHIGFVEVNGLRNVRLFNPDTNDFEQIAHMKYKRWYPSGILLDDGKMLVVGGVTKLIKSTQLSNIRRSETWDPETDTWREHYVGPESENSLPTQPRLFLTPNGKVFYGGAGQSWIPFGQAADEALWALQQFFDPKTEKWEVVGVNPLGVHDTAMSLPLPMDPPYDTLQLLTFGGTLGVPPGSWLAVPFSTITTVDSIGNVTNDMTGDLNHARWFASGISLPDGTILAVGGADKDEVIDPGMEVAINAAELYDPTTGEWTEMASHARDRTYHNSALLLPDMRVLLGGHVPIAADYGGAPQDQGGPFANNDNDPSFEVWSPPYLFRGERPSITRAQAAERISQTAKILAQPTKKKVKRNKMGQIEEIVEERT